MFDDLASPENIEVRAALDSLLTAPLAKLLRNRRYLESSIILKLFFYLLELLCNDVVCADHGTY